MLKKDIFEVKLPVSVRVWWSQLVVRSIRVEKLGGHRHSGSGAEGSPPKSGHQKNFGSILKFDLHVGNTVFIF